MLLAFFSPSFHNSHQYESTDKWPTPTLLICTEMCKAIIIHRCLNNGKNIHLRLMLNSFDIRLDFPNSYNLLFCMELCDNS